LPYLASSMAV